MQVTKYLAAKHEIKSFSLGQLYSNQTYSGHKTLRPVKEQLLPAALQRIISNGNCGFLDENTIWASKDGLWFYDINENTIEYVADLNVTAMISFEGPIVGTGVLMITTRHSAIYGFENNTLVETAYRFPLRGTYKCSTTHGSHIFIGYSQGLELIYHNGYGYVSSLCDGYGFFMRRNPINIDYINADRNYAVASDKHKLFIFSINKKLIHLHTEEFKFSDRKSKDYEIEITGCGIIESRSDSALIYVLLNDNSRLFLNMHLQKSLFGTKITLSRCLSKSGPFTEKNAYKQNFIFGDRILLIRNNKLGLITFNADQLVNPDASRAAENFTLLPFRYHIRAINISSLRHSYLSNSDLKSFGIYKMKGSEGIHSILSGNSSLLSLLTDQTLHRFKILTGPEQFLGCKPEESYQLVRAYGEKAAGLCQLHLLAAGHEVNPSAARIISEDSLYNFFVDVIEPLSGRFEDKDSSFFEKIDLLLNCLRNILRFKNYPAVRELTQSLEYLKILNKFQPDQLVGDVESAILGDTDFKNNSLHALLLTNTTKMLQLVEEKCSGFFPLGQIYHQRGLDILKSGRSLGTEGCLGESLACFRKSSENLTDVIAFYNKCRFFAGSAELLRRGMPSVTEISEALGCRRAFQILLDDSRQQFVYHVLEAAILRINQEDFSFLMSNCACCPVERIEKTPGLSEFFSIETPFLEGFLKEHFLISSSDYDLLWKYYLFKQRRNDAQSILVQIAEEKPMTISEKFEYLNKALYIGEPDEDIKRKVTLAKIQTEIQERLPHLSLNELLDHDELFNKYTMPFNFSDLSLRIIDITEFSNLEILKKIWASYLTDDFSTAKQNLKNIRISNTALNIDAIGTALLSIPGNNDCYSLLIEKGFSPSEIRGFFERILMSDSNNLPKDIVLEMMENHFKTELENKRRKSAGFGVI